MSKYITTVLICDDVPDSHGDTVLLDGVRFSDHPIPVSLMFTRNVKPIGMALLKKENNTVVAEIELPSDFSGSFFCGTIGGRIIDRENGVIKSCVIDEIGLTDIPSDRRLPKLTKI